MACHVLVPAEHAHQAQKALVKEFANYYVGVKIQLHDVLDVMKEIVCAHLVATATGCQTVLWERQNPRDRSGSWKKTLQ
jgi:hypothetical protein